MDPIATTSMSFWPRAKVTASTRSPNSAKLAVSIWAAAARDMCSEHVERLDGIGRSRVPLLTR